MSPSNLLIARVLPWLVPVMLAMPVAVPAIATLLSGRDIDDIASMDPGYLTPLSEWGLRLVTLAMVAFSALIVAERVLLSRERSAADPVQWLLLTGIVLFYVTNALLPGLFGAEPVLTRNPIYVLLLFLAIYTRRDDSPDRTLDLLRLTLVVFFAASFIYAAFRPAAALRFYAPELRLPFVPFRFWGLGPNANAMGPLAILLLMIEIVRPSPARWQRNLSYLTAVPVLVLSQSQTSWITGMILLPAMMAWLYAGRRGWRISLIPSPAALLALGGLLAGATVLWIAGLLDGPPDRVQPTNGLTGHGELLTGRGSIWRVAIDTFLAHPVFGYGTQAWMVEFRDALKMPYATSAHNQLLQSLSIGGVVGACGLLVCVVALMRASWDRGMRSRGLAPALLAMVLIRCLTETPLDFSTLLVGDTLLQGLLLVVALSPLGVQSGEPVPLSTIVPPNGRVPPLRAPSR